MTEEEYSKHRVGLVDIKFPEFTFDEMHKFLNDEGYKLIVHTGKAMVYSKNIDPGGEVRYGDKGKLQDGHTRVLAVHYNKYKLPVRVDSKEAIEMDALNVFHKLIKRRLLGLIEFNQLQTGEH